MTEHIFKLLKDIRRELMFVLKLPETGSNLWPNYYVLCFSLAEWLFGPFLCKITGYLQAVTVGASVNTLATVAVERYVQLTECLFVKLVKLRNSIDTKAANILC